MEFEDPRDADDAVRECDGQEMDQERITEPGKRIKVQISTGGRGGGGGGGGGGGYGGGGGVGGAGGYGGGGGYGHGGDRRDDRGSVQFSFSPRSG